MSSRTPQDELDAGVTLTWTTVDGQELIETDPALSRGYEGTGYGRIYRLEADGPVQLIGAARWAAIDRREDRLQEIRPELARRTAPAFRERRQEVLAELDAGLEQQAWLDAGLRQSAAAYVEQGYGAGFSDGVEHARLRNAEVASLIQANADRLVAVLEGVR